MSKLQALVVDHLPFDVAALRQALSHNGFNVTVVGTVQDAVNVLNGSHFDVVISDLCFQHDQNADARKAEALETIRRLREVRPSPAPIIATTHQVDPIHRDELTNVAHQANVFVYWKEDDHWLDTISSRALMLTGQSGAIKVEPKQAANSNGKNGDSLPQTPNWWAWCIVRFVKIFEGVCTKEGLTGAIVFVTVIGGGSYIAWDHHTTAVRRDMRDEKLTEAINDIGRQLQIANTIMADAPKRNERIVEMMSRICGKLDAKE